MNHIKKINEGVIDVIFNSLRYSTKVSNKGSFIEFKIILLGTQDLITFRLKKETFKNLISWLNEINPYKEE